MHDTLPSLDILVSTTASGMDSVPGMLLEPLQGVRYIVSVQHEGDLMPGAIPGTLTSRPDVTLLTLEGMGLSRNRNNTLLNSGAEICLLADDDNRYTAERILELRHLWADNPHADIITFRADTHQGLPLHEYPAPYVCSVEISLRRQSVMKHGIRFDTRFGLGSPLLKAGEEDIFLCDCRRAGLVFVQSDATLVSTRAITTASSFSTDRKLQYTKGAVFRYMYGPAVALWLSLKEAGWYLVHRHTNPFPIFLNMAKGIWILQ